MKLAYVTTYDPQDIHSWSGTGTFMLGALQEAGFQAEKIRVLQKNSSFISLMKKILYRLVSSKTYLRERDLATIKDYSTQVERALATVDYDILFSPGTIPIAYLQSKKPIVFWTDSTFAGMVDFYPGFTNLCAETLRDGNTAEQSALSNCRLAIYCSEWAANTAVQYYKVDEKKVKVVPFGANISHDRNIQDIQAISEHKDLGLCKLLFIGVEWYRKGGDIALQVADLLTKRGMRIEFNIVGCNPPIPLPGYARSYGFISKRTKEGSKLLEKLLLESHFLILPSRAECFAIVISEANSFGLPVLASKVGGLPSVIEEGKNGRLFSLDENIESYCSYIEGIMSSKQRYTELALSSFGEYTKRLNWRSAGRKVYELIMESCG